MNRLSGIRAWALALCMAMPALAVANTEFDLPQDNSLTWTLVGAQARAVAPGLLVNDVRMRAGGIQSVSVDGYAPARLGFYLGAASDPPVSIVGQDFRPDIAGRIKYGFYLVSTF
ncbi:hypothetical protein [Acidihalobacter prosperus]|uniref:Uncharacterized protein n=1 Tax=Acidihalobacter prosperus TaxID=160660 RepID=A0A1A6C4T5_9GAMM|nr:hypothetical protein [Acidihalobacter prosperus]OBS09581.1 hypothetical protein Thpro_021909 [Acidihalobacter prosperus]